MMHTVQGSGERTHVALTVYNEGTALVQDRRLFTLAEGENRLDFTDVSEQIDRTSIQLASRTAPGSVGVVEQSYAYDLVDSFALLKRYLEQVVVIITEDGTFYEGALLSGNGGDIILRTGDGQVIVVRQDKVRDMRFPQLPGGLLTRPTLRWLLDSTVSGQQELELTYLAGGISWTADYVLLVADGNDALDATGMVTFDNSSSASFDNARVKLIAGEVNRLPEPPPMAMMQSAPMISRAVGGAPKVAQREFSEYKLYEIERSVNLGANEQKQVEFIHKPGIPAKLEYKATSSLYWHPKADFAPNDTQSLNFRQFLEFETDERGMDAALPAGRVRIYQKDTDGAPLLIGEDRLDHTAKGEKVSLVLGKPFDIVGERAHTNFRRLGNSGAEHSYKVTVRNRKAEKPVEVRLLENFSGYSEWRITQATHPYDKIDQSMCEFRLTVAPKGETVLTYTVRSSW